METESVAIPIIDQDGRSPGELHVHVLPGRRPTEGPPPLLDLRGQASSSLPPIQLLEGTEYRYELHLPTGTSNVRCEPSSMFHPDDRSGLRGRLRTGLDTGTVTALFFHGDEPLGRATFEVRAAKLDYLTHYNRMLHELADVAAELLLERFAPAQHTFRPSPAQEPQTAYHQFAFLQSLVMSDHFEAAILQIVSNPHRTWHAQTEHRPPGAGAPARSSAMRALVGPGARAPLPGKTRLGPLTDVPVSLPYVRTEPTVDNPENRFIKHVLEEWRMFAQRVHDVLLTQRQSSPVERGLRETQEVINVLDRVVASSLLRNLGQLSRLPIASQVLQRREGYRDILRFYLQFQMASQLSWPGGEDVFGAGKRDVAKLYEFWVYLHFVKLLSAMCGRKVDFSALFETTEDGLQLKLRSGETLAVAGTVERLGRQLYIELWFNRTFSPSDPAAPSWTRRMRPDYSLRISPAPGSPSTFPDVWLHFDAKYRMESLAEGFGREEDVVTAADASGLTDGEVAQADLLKMHVYRDAIRRSVGAYVIYPGTEQQLWKEYHEILPGLGAFVLRPTPAGEPAGIQGLRKFLDDVLLHVASQVTRDERGRYWVREAYEYGPGLTRPVRVTPFLTKPPADTVVLLGYVRNEEHHRWITRHQRYNLRADQRIGRVQIGSRELAAEVVVLYGPTLQTPEVWKVVGPPEVWTHEDMLRTDYPRPRGKAYFCLPIVRVPEHQLPVSFQVGAVERLRSQVATGRAFGAPVATTWLETIAAHLETGDNNNGQTGIG